MPLHWFRIDREWVERRSAVLRVQEDAIMAAARDRATGEEHVFLEQLLELRRRNAAREDAQR